MNSEGSWNKRAGTAETEEGSVFVVWSLLTKFSAPQLSVFEIKLQSGPPPQTFGESQPCLKLYTFDGLIIDISSSTRPLHNVDTWIMNQPSVCARWLPAMPKLLRRQHGLSHRGLGGSRPQAMHFSSSRLLDVVSYQE